MCLYKNFLWCLVMCTLFNFLLIVSVVVIGSGPELLSSVMGGWKGMDFLFVAFVPSLVGTVLLSIGDVIIYYHHKR